MTIGVKPSPRPPAATRDFDIVLVLSGGNALGAFEAGVYQALHEHDLLPDWIVGASIGAINGALIAGAMPERRLETLRTFWRPDVSGSVDPAAPWFLAAADTARRTAAVTWTIAAGRSGLFEPALSPLSPWTDDKPSVFATEDLLATMNRLVDFDALNAGTCRYTATAVDMETGDDVAFDTRVQGVDARHIRASAALPVLFPPVEIDGRWFVDGGVSANLPLDPVIAEPPGRPILCIAVDLLPLSGSRPATLGEAASRMQDLIFAAQSRRTIERWRMTSAENADARVTLVRIAYNEQASEVAGKALDFSGPTIAQRWSAGHRAMLGLVEQVVGGSLPAAAPGLTIADGNRGRPSDPGSP